MRRRGVATITKSPHKFIRNRQGSMIGVPKGPMYVTLHQVCIHSFSRERCNISRHARKYKSRFPSKDLNRTKSLPRQIHRRLGETVALFDTLTQKSEVMSQHAPTLAILLKIKLCTTHISPCHLACIITNVFIFTSFILGPRPESASYIKKMRAFPQFIGGAYGLSVDPPPSSSHLFHSKKFPRAGRRLNRSTPNPFGTGAL